MEDNGDITINGFTIELCNSKTIMEPINPKSFIGEHTYDIYELYNYGMKRGDIYDKLVDYIMEYITTTYIDDGNHFRCVC